MNFLWNTITEWIKELLISGIMSNLSGLFDGINGQVAEIAGTVGTTPQAWNASVFNMIKTLSDNVIISCLRQSDEKVKKSSQPMPCPCRTASL